MIPSRYSQLFFPGELLCSRDTGVTEVVSVCDGQVELAMIGHSNTEEAWFRKLIAVLQRAKNRGTGVCCLSFLVQQNPGPCSSMKMVSLATRPSWCGSCDRDGWPDKRPCFGLIGTLEHNFLQRLVVPG